MGVGLRGHSGLDQEPASKIKTNRKRKLRAGISHYVNVKDGLFTSCYGIM